ncbi:sugar phosphate nucleotidyltransferase [Streptomyces hyaluromycini]|uniref:sugar phosphate nucleotidyltransferase n=1 Tax=Streptomyces hyaluromycini TaxID=1377993 RepID=UPI003F658CA7
MEPSLAEQLRDLARKAGAPPRPRVPGTRYALNGDVWARFSLREMARFHQERAAVATLALARTRLPWGMVKTDGFGRVVGFVEAPPSPYDREWSRLRL